MSHEAFGRILLGTEPDLARAYGLWQQQAVDWDLTNGHAPAPARKQRTIAPVRSRFWRSDDAGTRWRLITTVGLPLQAKWSALAVDQSDPDRLYAGSKWSGVWTSGDAGVHWTRITAAPRGVTSIRQDAALPARLWIGTDGYGIWRVDM